LLLYCRTSNSAVPWNYTFYAAAVIGPFVYIGAMVHAAFWRQISSIVGSIVSLQSILGACTARGPW